MEFGAIVTDAGTRKIMEAMHEGKKVNIVDFAVGDGGGAPCTPDAGATKLINEIWRGSVASCHMSEESENLLVIETVMPSDVGGFTIREMGIFDDEGILFAICNTPDTQKVKISDGVVHELNLIMEIALSNIDRVELIVDPCVLMATKKDIENLSKMLGNSPDGGSLEFAEGLDAKNVVDAINKLFTTGNEKKQKLVDNLIAMGIQASTEDTWGTLLDKILDMTDTSNDTVTEAVLIAGYTAHNAAGEQITGDMPELADVTVDATEVTQDDTYTYFGVPEGHYSVASKVRSANSNLSKKTTIEGLYLVLGQYSDNVAWAYSEAILPSVGCTTLKIDSVTTVSGNTGTGYPLKIYGFKPGASLSIGGYGSPANGILIGQYNIPATLNISLNIADYDRIMLIMHRYFTSEYQRFCVNNICII